MWFPNLTMLCLRFSKCKRKRWRVLTLQKEALSSDLDELWYLALFPNSDNPVWSPNKNIYPPSLSSQANNQTN
jgi:hypothetical protein